MNKPVITLVYQLFIFSQKFAEKVIPIAEFKLANLYREHLDHIHYISEIPAEFLISLRLKPILHNCHPNSAFKMNGNKVELQVARPYYI
jgi:hypothetical protein